VFAFVFFLLLIFVIALGVVAAFAAPQLRAGAPLFTARGDKIAQRVGHRVRPLHDVVWPRVRSVGGPVVNGVRAVARPVTKPLGKVLGPRVAPFTEAVTRAIAEGGTPAPSRPVDQQGPVRHAAGQAPSGPARPRPAPEHDPSALRPPGATAAKCSAA
jgi:hypothetical protein